jgi:hypothetical protein
MPHDELFSKRQFHEVAEERKQALIREIHGYDAATVLKTSTDELASYFHENYSMRAPTLRTEEKYLLDPPREITKQERVRDPFWSDDDEYVDRTRNYIAFTVCVPFQGDPALLNVRPSSYSFSTGRRVVAFVKGSEIRLPYSEVVANAQQDFSALYEKDISRIATNVHNLARDVVLFNAELATLIPALVTERKRVAEQSTSIIQAFKIPVRKRDDVPATYAIPEIRRAPRFVEPTKAKSVAIEPTLESEEYENILTIIKDMALAMERTPSTFARLSEEEIRDFFLISLNGHYQGNATGETFNGSGKTDILIRYKGANAFIAECKFWRGQKHMDQAIDQLLRYVTWRDTKTAILLFSKQPLTSALTKAKECIARHKHFHSDHQLHSRDLKTAETVEGYRFNHPSDSDKLIYLTLMGFQITRGRTDVADGPLR